jgi:hypothetical protein
MASITNPFAMLEDPSAMGLSKKARKKKKAAVEPAASSTPEVAAPVKVSPRPVPYACATHSPTAAHTLTLASRVGQPTAPPTAPSSLNTKGSPRAKPPRRPRRLDGTVPRTYPPIHQPLTRSTARPKPLQTRHVGATKGLPPPLRCWRGWGGTVYTHRLIHPPPCHSAVQGTQDPQDPCSKTCTSCGVGVASAPRRQYEGGGEAPAEWTNLRTRGGALGLREREDPDTRVGRPTSLRCAHGGMY